MEIDVVGMCGETDRSTNIALKRGRILFIAGCTEMYIKKEKNKTKKKKKEAMLSFAVLHR